MSQSSDIMATRSRSKRTCLVIGGCGFLGRQIVEALLKKGYTVNIFDIRSTFEDERVNFFIGDLCSLKDLSASLRDVDIVFHCATPPPLSNNKELFYKVNVNGTQNVIKACRLSGVKRLVLTSSASVIYEGRDIKNGTEDMPYAASPMDYYTETKILQEKLVMDANSDDLYTVALRPHGIFGPGDAHMLPTTARMAKSGKTKFIIGDGSNIVDFTYVENVVYGHILAAEHLDKGSVVCGKAYHLTNGEPLPFWTFMTRMITGLGYPAPSVHLPRWLLVCIARFLQAVSWLLSPIVTLRPTLTPMTVALASTHHYYSCERARVDMGYAPPVSLDDGIEKTLKSFPELRKAAG